MSSMPSLNKNNAAVKRIMQEARELANDPCTDYHAVPLEVSLIGLFSEWHCTIRGPSGTEFERGLYHFRILLPAEYPFRPPSLMMLTPNGRFELNTKICISFTNYHEEEWQPAWGVRTAILGLQGFFPLKGSAANGVGSVEYPVSERKRLAFISREWVCPKCQQTNLECLPDPPQNTPSSLNESAALRGLPRALDQSVPPVLQPSPTPQPAAPERSSRPETSSSDPDRVGPSTLATEPGPATIQARESPATAHTEAIRGSPLPVHCSRRSPLLLDTAICVLVVLVIALLFRRVL
ncbi:UBC-like protein [Chiua virens]|nr:UBC-like protein [Chiua virens]